MPLPVGDTPDLRRDQLQSTNYSPQVLAFSAAGGDDAHAGGGVSTYALLNATIFTDVTPGTVARGDLITGQGASPTWKRLAKGTANQVLAMDGTATDVVWTTVAGTGTVTSVGLTMPAIFAVGGSPVTTAGTLAVTLATETANTVWAGPTSGGAATPTFRALVTADIPTHALLDGATVSDSAAGAVVRGDLIVGNSTPKWARLAKGGARTFLTMGAAATDPGWAAITAADLPAIDHNTLANLTVGDVHTQYAFLAGRAGGQVLSGGTAAGDRLDLAGSTSANMGPLTVSTGARTLSGLRGLISLDPTLSHPGGLLNALYGIEIGARNGVGVTWTITNNMTVGGLSGAFGLNFTPGVRNAAATSITELGAWGLFANNMTLKAFGNNLVGTTADTSFVRMILDTPTITTDGVAGAVATLNELTTVYSRPTINPNTKTAQITARRGLWFRDQATASQGAMPTSVAVDVDDQTSSGAFTAAAAVRSAITDAAGKYFLRDIGGARSVISGKVRLGDTTDPTAALDVATGQANHLRMAGFAGNPASPTAGDHWYNTTTKSHRVQAAIGTEGLVGQLTAITASSTPVTANNVETAFSNGAFTIPANSLTVGKTIRVTAGGVLSTTATPGTLALRLRWGATNTTPLIVDCAAAAALTASMTNRGWYFEGQFTVRTTGASGTVVGIGVLTVSSSNTTGAATSQVDVTSGTVTIDQTTSTALTLFALWSLGSQSITLEHYTVEALD